MTARQCAGLVVALTLCGTSICDSGSRTGKGLPPEIMQIHGAGATFPAPLYKKWREEYHKRYPQVLVSYDPIGSGEGTKQFIAGAVDFGASDAAMSDEAMAQVERGVQLVPVVAGSIVLAYNLEGLVAS
jgi:phosphate transport system substrate-binding protein